MSRKNRIVPTCIAVACMAAVAGSFAIAQSNKGDKPATPPAHLPAGWSEADMQACVAAGTPGAMHEHLAKLVGTWHGTTTMWMDPATEPAQGECTWTVTSVMDGRFTQATLTGDMPGMGTYHGFGISGFDNVSQRFVSDWIDDHCTGIMSGTGELSKDGTKLSWRFTYNCPITKKPAVVRQIETYTSADAMSFEMFSTDPKSGKEYKCMHIDFARES
jgi:hypothetical protein